MRTRQVMTSGRLSDVIEWSSSSKSKDSDKQPLFNMHFFSFPALNLAIRCVKIETEILHYIYSMVLSILGGGYLKFLSLYNIYIYTLFQKH